MHTENKNIDGVIFPPIIPYQHLESESRYTYNNLISQYFISLLEHCQNNGVERTDFTFTGVKLEHWFNLRKKKVAYRIEKEVTELLTVSICSFSRYESGGLVELQNMTFEMKQDGKESSKSYFLTRGFIEINKTLLSLFNGSEVEVNRSGALSTNKIDWDYWKENDEKAVEIYGNIIYPCFFITICRIALFLEKRPMTVLDIGGGDGELALNIAAFPSVKKITVLDNNLPSIEKLKRRTSEHECPFIDAEQREKVKGKFVDITKYSHRKDPVDIIILCGVVAHQVLNRTEAVILMKRCKEWIKDDGFILVASYSNKYFSRKNYEAFGYQVHNTVSFSTKTDSDWEAEPEPFYILQKKI